MWKKIFTSIIIATALAVCIKVFFVITKLDKNITNLDEQLKIAKDESSAYVTDDCIKEWEDYALTVQEEIKQASEPLNDENRHYILREENKYIKVYYKNEENQEVLYKATDIATKYLPKEDAEKLKEGIEVVGIQNLNQLLEDYE